MRHRDLPSIEDLPRWSASQVRSQFPDLVRQVRESGAVAVTRHGEVEMVVIGAAIYQKMSASFIDHSEDQLRAEGELARLSAEFDRRLAGFKNPGISNSVETVMRAGGRTKRRPKAGPTFLTLVAHTQASDVGVPPEAAISQGNRRPERASDQTPVQTL